MKTKPTPTPAIAAVEIKQASVVVKDRQGFTMEQLLAVQARQLSWWKALLQPEHYKKLEAFCERCNRPAKEGEMWPHGLHVVPRGVQLQHFLQDRAKFLLDDDEEDGAWPLSCIPPHEGGKEGV